MKPSKHLSFTRSKIINNEINNPTFARRRRGLGLFSISRFTSWHRFTFFLNWSSFRHNKKVELNSTGSTKKTISFWPKRRNLRCLPRTYKTTRLKKLHHKHLTTWFLISSERTRTSKSAGLTKKSIEIASPQTTAHIVFLKLPKRGGANHVIFQLELQL